MRLPLHAAVVAGVGPSVTSDLVAMAAASR